MRFSYTIFSLCFLFATQVVAQGVSLAALPPCALSCLIQTVPASGCSFTDVECQCSSQPLYDATTTCVMSNCTLAEALIVMKFNAALCNLPENQSRRSYIRGVILGGLAANLVSVIGRCLSRWRMHGKFFFDDWLVLGAVVMALSLAGTVLTMVRYGLGLHAYQLSSPAAEKILLYFFINYPLYIILTVLVKVSLVVFYLRLFPQRRFRIACWILLAYILIGSIAWLFTSFFQCLPISANWNIYAKDPNCHNIQIIQYLGAGLHISQNFLILLLPLPIVVRLKVDLRKKVSLVAMFSLGAFVILCTCVRLRYFYFSSTTSDPSWGNVGLVVWSALEIDVGIICCNMPAIATFIQYLWNRNKTPPLSQPAANDPYNKAPFRSIHSMINENGERVERESIFEVQALPAVMTGPKRGFGLKLLKPLSRSKVRSKKSIPRFPEPWEVRSGHIHDRTEVTIMSFPEPPPRLSRKMSITQLKSRTDSRSRDRRKLKGLSKDDGGEKGEIDEQDERLKDMEKRMQEESGALGILITRDVAVDSNVIETIPEDRQLGSQERLFHEKPR